MTKNEGLEKDKIEKNDRHAHYIKVQK